MDLLPEILHGLHVALQGVLPDDEEHRSLHLQEGIIHILQEQQGAGRELESQPSNGGDPMGFAEARGEQLELHRAPGNGAENAFAMELQCPWNQLLPSMAVPISIACPGTHGSKGRNLGAG